ncbi:hypothetical protein, partial [Streptomyces roseolus]|uniref:hypothetical protein n=1 Tax=Streptomyces roseolus TaxID=67358 RepID=UPI001E5F7942
QHHRHPGLRRPHHRVRPLRIAAREPVHGLRLEAEPVADPGSAEPAAGQVEKTLPKVCLSGLLFEVSP